MVNLYKLTNAQARNANFEQILRIVNDNLQGAAIGLGFVFGGTPDFLMNPRRGLYSYYALQTRLQENSFARGGLIDLSGPIVRLQALTPEDLYVLLMNLRNVYALGDPLRYLIPDEGLVAFLRHCQSLLGDAYFRTPRNTVKAFLNVLDILDQNEGVEWTQLVDQVAVSGEANTDEDDELATLTL
jgi:hypothetical protein